MPLSGIIASSVIAYKMPPDTQNCDGCRQYVYLPTVLCLVHGHIFQVLHISIFRFVFDVATLSRKKSKQAVHFPTVLDMTPFVDAESSGTMPVSGKRGHSDWQIDPNLIYDLRGVLLHKGPSAYHGHYEAQVYDVT
jgi:hypothetical protein